MCAPGAKKRPGVKAPGFVRGRGGGCQFCTGGRGDVQKGFYMPYSLIRPKKFDSMIKVGNFAQL